VISCCLTLSYLFRFGDFGEHQSALKSTLICLAIDGKQWNCIMNDGTMLLCQELKSHDVIYSYHFYRVSAIESEDKCFHLKQEPLHQTWVLHINSFCSICTVCEQDFLFFGEVFFRLVFSNGGKKTFLWVPSHQFQQKPYRFWKFARLYIKF
jgi:hypothetical protein